MVVSVGGLGGGSVVCATAGRALVALVVVIPHPLPPGANHFFCVALFNHVYAKGAALSFCCEFGRLVVWDLWISSAQ